MGQVYCWGHLDNENTTQCRLVKCLMNRQVKKLACSPNQVSLYVENNFKIFFFDEYMKLIIYSSVLICKQYLYNNKIIILVVFTNYNYIIVCK